MRWRVAYSTCWAPNLPSWSTLEMPQASAVKTAGSLVPVKPDLQCGSGPRVQYSDDLRDPPDRERSRLGDYFRLHGPGRRTRAEKDNGCPRSEPSLSAFQS